MQEVGLLAIRADWGESLARTISMTTELQVTEEVEDQDAKDKPQERALIMSVSTVLLDIAILILVLAVSESVSRHKDYHDEV